MQGADGKRLAEAKLVELDGRLATALALGLVGDEDDRLVDASQVIGHIAVPGGQALLTIDHEEDYFGFVGRNLHLGSDEFTVRQRAVHEQAAGVDEPNALSSPFDVAVNAITSRPSRFFDEGLASPDYAVEQSRLPNVRPANEGYDRVSGFG